MTALRKPKTGKTKMIAFRIEPRLRYLAEIAARKNDESLSNFVERAIAYALSLETTERLRFDEADHEDRLPRSLRPTWLEHYWSDDEAERFANLAIYGQFKLFNREEQETFRRIMNLLPAAARDIKPTHEQIQMAYRKLQRLDKGVKKDA